MTKVKTRELAFRRLSDEDGDGSDDLKEGSSDEEKEDDMEEVEDKPEEAGPEEGLHDDLIV